MKIAFILPSLANRGPVIFTKYLIDAIYPYCENVNILYFKDCPKSMELNFSVKCKKISFFEKINLSQYDIIHTTMFVPDLYGAIKIPAKKWIVSMHNYYKDDVGMLYKKNPLKKKVISFLWYFALLRSKNVIVSSKAMLEYYSTAIGHKNYNIIPYGIKEKPYMQLTENDINKLEGFKKKGYLIIGSVGLLVYRKGFSQLIELLKSNCDIALVIIGEGPERNNLETLAKKNNVLDRIWLPGFRNDSYSYYKYFDIYAHVSYSEGFGLAMLEALSHKIPLICSRLDIYREYFTDEDVSYFEAGNVCALNKALYIIRNKLPFYSKKSYDLFLKYFSDEAMAKKHKEYYESIISDNKKFLLE